MHEKDRPDHHDAEIALRVYDLRRESLMRESRTAINRNFWPKSYDDVLAVSKPEHPLNAAFRQTSTYWEMVYGMVKWGILHPDFMMESNSEGMFVFAKAEAHLEAIRAQGNPVYFSNTEWLARNTDAGKRALERYRARVKSVLETR